jgi:hypothetical protein
MKTGGRKGGARGGAAVEIKKILGGRREARFFWKIISGQGGGRIGQDFLSLVGRSG